MVSGDKVGQYSISGRRILSPLSISMQVLLSSDRFRNLKPSSARRESILRRQTLTKSQMCWNASIWRNQRKRMNLFKSKVDTKSSNGYVPWKSCCKRCLHSLRVWANMRYIPHVPSSLLNFPHKISSSVQSHIPFRAIGAKWRKQIPPPGRPPPKKKKN